MTFNFTRTLVVSLKFKILHCLRAQDRLVLILIVKTGKLLQIYYSSFVPDASFIEIILKPDER